MTQSGSRRGAASLSPVLMVLSFLCMAGLLVWLGKSAEETRLPVVMDEGEAIDSVEANATSVTLEQLGTSAATYVGQTVMVEAAPVTAHVGEGTFLVGGVGGPSGPVLVVLDSALIASGEVAPSSGAVTIVGTVREKGDTDVDGWVEMNLLPENQRPMVDRSTHWVDAHRVRPSDSEAGAS